jgi:hypothetical protein
MLESAMAVSQDTLDRIVTSLVEEAKPERSVLFGSQAREILVYSSDEVERWRESRNHVVGRALREGRVLYERP